MANSLFHKLPDPVADASVKLRTCKCQVVGATAQCVDENNVIYGGLRKKNTKNIKQEMEDQNTARRKRDVQYTDKPTDEDFDMFMRLGTNEESLAKRIKRADSGWGPRKMSIENATRYCNETLAESTVAKLCKESADVDVENLISQCATDVSVSENSDMRIICMCNGTIRRE